MDHTKHQYVGQSNNGSFVHLAEQIEIRNRGPESPLCAGLNISNLLLKYVTMVKLRHWTMYLYKEYAFAYS